MKINVCTIFPIFRALWVVIPLNPFFWKGRSLTSFLRPPGFLFQMLCACNWSILLRYIPVPSASNNFFWPRISPEVPYVLLLKNNILVLLYPVYGIWYSIFYFGALGCLGQAKLADLWLEISDSTQNIHQCIVIGQPIGISGEIRGQKNFFRRTLWRNNKKYCTIWFDRSDKLV